MRLRASLLLVLLSSAALAGCFKGDEPEEKLVVPTPPTPTGPPPPIECDECDEVPPVDPNSTDGRMHGHDYWGGETRKVVASFDSGLIPLPLLPDGKAAGTAIADYDLEPPNLVYEGSSHLEVVFTKVCVWGTESVGFLTGDTENPCPAAHPHITIFVDYLTAADEPGAFRSGGQATPGQALVIPVSPLEADMPHQTKSLWLFRIYTGEANAFTYNVTITAVKGSAVAEWPPHPDLYANGPERVVLEGDFMTKSAGLAEYYLYGSDANWVYPERVISYGTQRVEVEVVLGTLSATGGVQPSFYYLDYKNASYLSKVGNGDMSGGRLVGESGDGSTFLFTVPVDAQGYDTPYGAQSRWGFRFMARFGDESQCPDVDQSLQQGCQMVPYELTYTMKVVAHGSAAPAAAAPGA